ncbi:MAG: MBL fold metallo-hydrolase [Bacteroidetes bacterium]|nr:MAG: MBL fold metallo-hydrolase [Bacteroidota bacterium]
MKTFSPLYLLLMLVLFSSCTSRQPVQIESSHFELVPLARGVYACIHRAGGKAICNAGIVDNGEATFIFDTFLSPEAAAELPEMVKKLKLSPLKYVINSHYHNDHIRGNQVFGSGVSIISTPKTARLITEREARAIAEEQHYAPAQFRYFDSLYQHYQGDTQARAYQVIQMMRPYFETLAKSHEEIHTRLPDTFVDSIQVFEGPARSVQLISLGKGHTDSDLILYVPEEGILFSGDLIFNGYHPFLGDGSLPGWQHSLHALQQMEISTIVPGHGDIGDNSLIQQMQQYLHTLDSLAAAMQQQGLKAENVQEVPIPEAYRHWWLEHFFPLNLRTAFEQMSEPHSANAEGEGG